MEMNNEGVSPGGGRIQDLTVGNSLTCGNSCMTHNFICVKNTWVVCWDGYLEPGLHKGVQ